MTTTQNTKDTFDFIATVDVIRGFSDDIVKRLKDERECNIPELARLVKHFPSYKFLAGNFEGEYKLHVLSVITELTHKHIALFNRAVERYILSRPAEMEETYREAFKSLL